MPKNAPTFSISDVMPAQIRSGPRSYCAGGDAVRPWASASAANVRRKISAAVDAKETDPPQADDAGERQESCRATRAGGTDGVAEQVGIGAELLADLRRGRRSAAATTPVRAAARWMKITSSAGTMPMRNMIRQAVSGLSGSKSPVQFQQAE